MSTTVGLIDYGIGNLFSVENALRSLRCNVTIATKPEMLIGIDKVILPGVGAFPDGMRNLNDLGFSEFIKNHVFEGGVLLGICLGMQLILTEGHEGGRTKGLDLVSGIVEPIVSSKKCRVPHMGWNEVETSRGKKVELFKDIDSRAAFYFVHSYQAVIDEDIDVAHTNYCNRQIIAAFQKKNVFGVQFHPEKSQKAGLKLLDNFIQMSA